MRRRAPARAPPSRPSNLSRCASDAVSFAVACGDAGRLERWMGVAVVRSSFAENGDEHRWNILQAIFRLGVVEHRGVIAQFVCYLVNHEAAAGCERVIGPL